jgi:hypothetical protein
MMSKLTAYMPRTRLLFAFVAVFVLAQMLSVMSAHSQSEPGAPTGVTATAGNAQATIAFNAPASVGGGPIMSYWVTASPGNVIGSGGSSPIIMTGLTNGTAYTFVVSATNYFGTGPNSSPSNSVTPYAAPLTLSPPAGALAEGTVGSAYTAYVTASGGTVPYEYAVTAGSLPAGLSLNTSTGAITGTPTTSGTASFTVRATDRNSVSGSASYSLTVNPAVVITLSPSAGALTTATAGSAYTTSVTASGGTAPYRYEVSAGSLPQGLSLNTSTGAITGTPSVLGSAFFTITATDSNSVSGSAAYSLAVSVVASTPNAHFQNNPLIWLGTPNPAPPLFIEGPTLADLHDTFTFSGSFFGWMRDVNSESCFLGLGALSVGPYGTTTSNVSGRGGCSSGSASTAFNIDGTFDANSVTLSSKGTFSGVSSAFGGNWQRVVFGDFNLQHNSDTGSSTASLNGRVAWQTMTSPNTTLGYFLDGQLAHSNIAGTFEGEQSTYGVAVGGYGVHALGDQLKLNGTFSLGAGQNNLEITDTILALESDYLTRSATIGAALSGVVQQDGFEVRPELSFNYGRTWIGNVDFTGRAFGIVDDTLSLDAGQVSLATMMLRPEVRVPLDALSGANSLQVVTFAPRLMCEQIKAATTEENCGGGAEVGFSGRSANGLSSVSAKVMADRIGGATISSLQLSLEHRF